MQVTLLPFLSGDEVIPDLVNIVVSGVSSSNESDDMSELVGGDIYIWYIIIATNLQ